MIILLFLQVARRVALQTVLIGQRLDKLESPLPDRFPGAEYRSGCPEKIQLLQSAAKQG